ncbi:electron transfer flavoprotein subunit alpha/FixB family protein [Caldithrix abyssi]
MKMLIYGEHRDGQIRKITFENITLARQLGAEFEVVFIGQVNDDFKEQAAKYGASKVLFVKNEKLNTYSPDGYAKVLMRIIKDRTPDVLLMGATATGKDLAPRVSALLNAPMATDCIKVELENGQLKLVRPMYAGKVRANIQLNGDLQIVTVRPNVYQASEQAVDGASEEISVEAPDFKAIVKEIVSGAKEKLDVTEADIIVSGGRGMKGPENWHLIEELASLLGAATGASRAAVDAGWRPHDEQVGQTGKTVSPTLYIAVGISGAIQHLAGMSSSKYIVAINKDPEAPIFKIADYGIVADLFEVLPRMIEELKKMKN